MRAQLDHHCILVVRDTPSRITRVQDHLVAVRCENGCCTAVIDIQGLDLDAYCVAAAMNDFANAARAERGLPIKIGSEARN